MLDHQSGHTRSIDRYHADVEVDIVFKAATSQAQRTLLDASNWALVTINAAGTIWRAATDSSTVRDKWGVIAPMTGHVGESGV